MKHSRGLLACFILVFSLLSGTVWATAPVLSPLQTMPAEGQPGNPVNFHMLYTQKEGDGPTTLKMVMETPSGTVTSAPTTTEGSDPSAGISAVWTFTPQNNGNYKYHFEAVSSTGGTARYPVSPTEELEYALSSIGVKYAIFVVGLIIAMAFLPFIVYVGSRSINKSGDPAAAARVGLFIGVLASYALFWFLFFQPFGVAGVGLAGLAAVAILIVLMTRR